MKLILLVFASVLALAFAQTRPTFKDTFVAALDIEIHAEQTVFGKGMRARSTSQNSAMTNFTVANRVHAYQLSLYNTGKQYDIRGETTERCGVRNLTMKSLPSYWDFLKVSVYVGEIEIRHVAYDVWEFHGADVRISVAVTKASPMMPHAIETEIPGQFILEVFTTYKEEEPPKTMFTIPKQCQ